MRALVTLLVYLLSLVPTAVAAFYAVLFLAGPHGGVLPSSLHTATLVIGWLCVLLIPMLVARWAWRRYSRANP